MKDKIKKLPLALGILALIGLVIGGSIVWTAVAPIIQQYGEQQQAAQQMTEETSAADYAMQQREWFAQQRQDILAMQDQINNTRDQLDRFYSTYGKNGSQWSYTTRQRHGRITDRLYGYRDQYETYVADYNSRMNVSYQAQYNNSLPLEMEKKFWTGDLVP